MRTTLLVVAAASALALMPISAEAASPPPPARMTETVIRKWMADHLQTTGWTVIAMQAGSGVVLGDPKGVFVLQDDTLRTRLRNEYFESQDFGQLQVRSTSQTWNIDCATRRFRILNMSVFAENNMAGQSMTRTFDQPVWDEAPKEGTWRGLVVKRVCEAPTTGKRLR